MHSWRAAAPIKNPKIPLHSVYSVHSVVENLNHGLHRMHGVGLMKANDETQGDLGKMHQLFGDQMDELIEELNGELLIRP